MATEQEHSDAAQLASLSQSMEKYNQSKRPQTIKARILQRPSFWCAWCCCVTLALLILLIPILYFILLPKLVQYIVNGSQMSLEQLNITQPTEAGMWVNLRGGINHGGLIPASIEFPEPVIISWKGFDLGKMAGMEVIDVSGGKGDVVYKTTQFEILDSNAFSNFTREMLTTESFVWQLRSVVNVKVLGLIPFQGINLNKEMTILGMNNFGKISIKKFDLPSDAPNNQGAMIKLVTLMNNPSPIGMTLGSIVLDLFYNNTHLGQVTAQNATLLGGSESPLELEGVLFRQIEAKKLTDLSVMMSNYLGGKVTNTTAKGVLVKPDGTNPVSWLSNGLTGLTLNVPLQSPDPLQIIQGIQAMDMGIAFPPATPYVPTVSSKTMIAGFKIPFNITVNATTITNSIALGYQDKMLGNINGSVPSLASTNIPGMIAFSLPPSPLVVKEDAHDAFSTFLADLTTRENEKFLVIGKSNAKVETALGLITLTDIPFNSPVTMKGLNFNGQQTTISNTMVVGGTSEHAVISLVITLSNPSTLTVAAGNVTLQVLDSTTNQFLGDLVIQNLTIVPGGAIRVPAQLLFRPIDPLFRDQFFTRFIAGETFPLLITGSPTSTPIPELQKALSLITLGCSVTGLVPMPVLLPSGRASSTINTVLGTHQTSIWFDIQNPLLVPMYCSSINAIVTWRGDQFGTISQAVGFQISGGQNRTTTPELMLQHPQNPGFSAYLTTNFMPAYPGVTIGNGALVPFEVDLQLTVRIGGETGYTTTISYKQSTQVMVKLTVVGLDLGGTVNGVLANGLTQPVEHVVQDVSGNGGERVIANNPLSVGGVSNSIGGSTSGISTSGNSGRGSSIANNGGNGVLSSSGGGGDDGSGGRSVLNAVQPIEKVVGGLAKGIL
ncbi:hypothetical protein FBU30_000934 [Linnemannia zychae]|nr:hypothetical protein FBU30_000934 [Linnemannia zychae]